MSDQINNLSDDARNCLVALWEAALNAAGGDFGFSGEAYEIWQQQYGGSQQQFAGLYGALVNAGLVYSDDEVEVNGRRLNESQYDFSDEAREYLWLVMG